MSRGIVKLEAFRSLKAHIEAAIPELRDKVVTVQTPPDQHLKFPSLAIVAGGSFRHSFAQEDIVALPTNHSAVVCVGAWETTVQLRLACATEFSRFDYEERLSDLFFQREDSPGLILTQVTACPQLGDILASWDLGNSSWDEEYAFSAQEWAVLTIQATIPALALREGVYTIDDLRLGLTGDFSIATTSAAFDTLPNLVQVNEDGTITTL